jgi:hypothetical protein
VRVPWLYCRLLYTIVSSIRPLKSADPYFEDIKKLDCETSRLSKVKIGRIKRPNAKRRELKIITGRVLKIRARIRNTLFYSELMNWPNKLECLLLACLSVRCDVIL